MKKIIKWVVIVVILLVVIGVAVVLMNLNSIIRSTVESQGTAQLQVPTKLGGVNLSLLGGDLALNDFSIGSPKGFNAPQMLALGKAHVAVSYSDLRGDPVKVGKIELEKPKLVIEQSGMNLNFKALMDQLPKGEPQPAPTPQGESKPLKLIIDTINIKGAQVQFLTSIPGANITIDVPDIALEKVGTGDGSQNGAAVKDVVMLVVTSIAAKAADSDKIPAELKPILQGNLAATVTQLKGKAQEIAEQQLGKVTDKLGENVGKTAGDVLHGKTPTTQDMSNAAGDLLKGFGAKKDKK